MKSIAVFNNKGGVGKTTLLCNLAGYLCKKKKKKILVIDADPQCNTTTYVLDEEQFIDVYYEPTCFTIADIVPPLEDGSGYIQEFNITESTHFGFDVIPGNPKFAACEDFLASEWKDVKSSELRGIKSTMLFFHFLTLCDKYDYVFFDMGPSLGAINRSILLSCDFFITPISSDVFSLLALENIGKSIVQWAAFFDGGISKLEQRKRESLNGMKQSCSLRFLGYVEQQYISKSVGGTPRAVQAYDKILQKIPDEIYQNIILPINHENSSITEYKIGSIPNFHSLVLMSQSAHKPIFELLNVDGVVGAHYQKVKDFSNLMDLISQNMLTNVEAFND
ncbi:MAG: ParA family protein [Thermoguttaceae bacterium]|nr:ParA family protein [Thermoguttaceae bacterium]